MTPLHLRDTLPVFATEHLEGAVGKGACFALLLAAALLGFSAGYFVAAPLRGGLVRALVPILTTPASAAALVAAGVSLLVGVVSPIVTYRLGQRQAAVAQTAANAAMMTAQNAGARALANVRLEWLKSLRDTLSKYHSILMSADDGDPDADDTSKAKAEEKWVADQRELSYLGTQLDLLLNQKKQYQQALWKISDEILKMETQDECQQADGRLVIAAREVLDFHWRKIKAEILGEPPIKEPTASA